MWFGEELFKAFMSNSFRSGKNVFASVFASVFANAGASAGAGMRASVSDGVLGIVRDSVVGIVWSSVRDGTFAGALISMEESIREK